MNVHSTALFGRGGVCAKLAQALVFAQLDASLRVYCNASTRGLANLQLGLDGLLRRHPKLIGTKAQHKNILVC